ncbi:MAG: methylmalonyl-CoA mutase, partial [Arenicella sp.]
FTIELARSTDAEKKSQIARLEAFKAKHAAHSEEVLEEIKMTIIEGENGFAALMDAVRHCSLGEITDAFFEVGGQYRRST